MLHFEFHKRPDTDDIIQKVKDLDSKVVKRTSRASTASLRSGPSYEAKMNVDHHLCKLMVFVVHGKFAYQHYFATGILGYFD